MGLGGGLDLHGEKTDAEMVEHLAWVHVSHDGDWRLRIEELRAAVAKVEAACLRDERMDAVRDVRTRVETELWVEHGDRWVTEALAMAVDGKTAYRVDHVAAEERLSRYLEEAKLADLYDESIDDTRVALDAKLDEALWEESQVDRDWS